MKKEYKIIGKPLAHSLSPTLHNYWFKKYKVNSHYDSLEIEENDLEKIIKKIREKKIAGINITLPYKQKIIPFLDKMINEAKEANSVNTVYLNKNNEIIGENTDVYGVQAGYLKETTNNELKNKKALILGAGGVAPSVILSLSKSNVSEIFIANRTYEKAIFLKKKFPYLKIIKWEEIDELVKDIDIFVNATSLGLRDNDVFNFNLKNLKNSLIYIDTIYNPTQTNMIKKLKKQGIKTFNGLNMFVYQGQKSFYLWNKINPTIDEELLDLLIKKIR